MLTMVKNDSTGDYHGVSPYSDYILRTNGNRKSTLGKLTWYQLKTKFDLIANPSYQWTSNRKRKTEGDLQPQLVNERLGSKFIFDDAELKETDIRMACDDAEISDTDIMMSLDDAEIDGVFVFDDAKIDDSDAGKIYFKLVILTTTSNIILNKTLKLTIKSR
jgi:hypothetical protein